MKKPTTNRAVYFWLSLLICTGYFIAFISPNRAASENIKMVAVFEPDESLPLRYVLEMLDPADSLKEALKNFVFYDYYYYGFPYFASSGVALLPLASAGQLDDTPMVMLTLRQGISVLPMLLVILLLVHIQTGYRSYRSILLLLLLLSLPAVVRNNFWWHPDSLAILFAMLVIYFLQRDDLRFGVNFYLAAAMCGFSAGTKGIGFYFFLTIFVYLLYGLVQKRKTWKRASLSAVGFLICMAIAYVVANPMLLYEEPRTIFFSTMRRQSFLLSAGYGIQYRTGLSIALPTLKEYYGSVLFLLAAIASCLAGIVWNRERLLNMIILTWFLPISILIFWITHFKFQYWLPVALPLFSSMVHFLPEKIAYPASLRELSSNAVMQILPSSLLSILLVVQLASFLYTDVQRFTERTNRAENNPSIQFYGQAVQILEPLPQEELFIYHEVRMYFPPTGNWRTRSLFVPLDYDYIRSSDFDVLLLMQQRISDYLNEGVQGVDPEKFARSQLFYRDANNETVEGYRLVFRNGYGLIFVKEALYQEYFE